MFKRKTGKREEERGCWRINYRRGLAKIVASARTSVNKWCDEEEKEALKFNLISSPANSRRGKGQHRLLLLLLTSLLY